MLLLGADVGALSTPDKCHRLNKMAVIGSESTLTARSMLLRILDKEIALVNSVNHIIFPSLQLVIKLRSRFLTFDACLSQTSLREMAFNYNQDLNLP